MVDIEEYRKGFVSFAQAAEDHRASGRSEPRSIYGKLVAEADRVIDCETIIRRTIQFGCTPRLPPQPDLRSSPPAFRGSADVYPD